MKLDPFSTFLIERDLLSDKETVICSCCDFSLTFFMRLGEPGLIEKLEAAVWWIKPEKDNKVRLICPKCTAKMWAITHLF